MPASDEQLELIEIAITQYVEEYAYDPTTGYAEGESSQQEYRNALAAVQEDVLRLRSLLD